MVKGRKKGAEGLRKLYSQDLGSQDLQDLPRADDGPYKLTTPHSNGPITSLALGNE